MFFELNHPEFQLKGTDLQPQDYVKHYEKLGDKYGADWLIYQTALLNLKLLRRARDKQPRHLQHNFTREKRQVLIRILQYLLRRQANEVNQLLLAIELDITQRESCLKKHKAHE